MKLLTPSLLPLLPLLLSATTTLSLALPKRALDNSQINGFVESLDVSDTTASKIRTEMKKTQVNTNLACWIANAVLGDAEVTTRSEDAEITALMQVNWSQTCWLKPQCVVSPTETRQVSQVLKIVSTLRTNFQVRSGGHSPNPRWASGGDGVLLIDLAALNMVDLSADKKVARVGPGNRWNRVYDVLDTTGVTVVGGRLPTVGVGGLMLGGGLSHWSNQYGMAADRVKNFEVVLTNGSVVDANSGTNPDLWWALKGGGPNFGIVTRFDLLTVPINNIWFAVYSYPAASTPAALQAFVEYQTSGSADTKSSLTFLATPSATLVFLVYSSPVATPAAFAPFYALEDRTTLVERLGSVRDLSEFAGATVSAVSARHDYRGVSTKIDGELYEDMYAFWRTRALAAKAAYGADMTFVLQHITPELVAAGDNPLGLPAVAHQWWTTLIDWASPADDVAVRAVAKSVTDKWRADSAARGSDLPFEFMNDASRDQNPIGSYGAANVARLRSVAARYDPRGVMQTGQVGGWLLRDV
ncbi:putative 6-hydroxy-D-nicotine oxidase [Geopyxis carbonaria]|nr:putative 6-hydroxy-D-nicotine oxidase [Geopyxis carbonaria]